LASEAGRNGVTSSATRSLFEQALDLCETSAEREKVQRLAVRLQLNENASEWIVLVLHAEGRNIFGDHGDKTLAGIEQRLDDMAKRKPVATAGRTPQADGPFAGIIPIVCAFVAGAAICEAAFFALANRWLPPVFNGVAMFVSGLSVTAGILIYLWLWPIYVGWRDRRW
jgi:hypothetical protein